MKLGVSAQMSSGIRGSFQEGSKRRFGWGSLWVGDSSWGCLLSSGGEATKKGSLTEKSPR